MEEWVGQKWHHFITSKSRFHYPEQQVHLADISHQLGVFFRALGGHKSWSLGHTSAQPHHSHRNWIQKISGTGKKAELCHFSGDHFYLPEHLACFPTLALNRDLYFWLAAMGSFNHSPRAEQVIEHNQYLTQCVLTQWPGIKACYQRLAQAHLQQRPQATSLPTDIQAAEQAIQNILTQPFTAQPSNCDPKHMPPPVPLWLKAHASKHGLRPGPSNPPENSTSQAASSTAKTNKTYQAEAVDQAADDDGFIAFRLESLFSWSEFINVDRSEDDSDDEGALRVADDLDQLSINQGETSHKIRLDLDLPASEYDDLVVADGILLPEWDYQKNRYLKDHCALQLMALRSAKPASWPAALQQQVHQLRRQFESLKPINQWHNRQADGEEIDWVAYLDLQTALASQTAHSNQLYRHRKRHNRDLSTLILTDWSLSTDAHLNDQKKVIDVIKEALYLLAHGLQAAGEHFAIAGFTSKHRSHVRYYEIKAFDQAFDQACEDLIHAIQPAYYTRMGAAIRYASQQLSARQSQQKLLLILTDGKPNDLDKYESRYGLEDTRKAVQEARQLGLTPFCVSIDYQASDYLPLLFGNQGFVHLKDALKLPAQLPKLFAMLLQQ